MDESLISFISSITVVFGIFGVFLFVKLFSTWKNIDKNLIKARVFLAEGFVVKNIVVIFIVGLLIAMHNFIVFLELACPEFYYRQVYSRFPSGLFSVTILLASLLMVDWLMFRWIKLTR
ncbi:MAG: hypothetical protein ACNA7I_03470 [Candidatus Methanoperedens sp.]